MLRIKLLPKAQQLKHIDWFSENNINSFDLGMLSRTSKGMHNKYELSRDELCETLRDARYFNAARKKDVFIRPHKNTSWKMIFADDVEIKTATSFANQYSCLLVHTSREGGCQLWVPTDQLLSQQDRYSWQKSIINVLNADPGSVSGEHYGRLAGFKNHKRNGQWCNLYGSGNGTFWNPESTFIFKENKQEVYGSKDDSESAKEFGFACHSLRHGVSDVDIVNNITQRASLRGKKNVATYVRRTLAKAKGLVVHGGAL